MVELPLSREDICRRLGVAIGLLAVTAGCTAPRSLARAEPPAAGVTTGKQGPAAPSAPGELVWFDHELVFAGPRPIERNPVTNWHSPVDYFNGEIHMRAVVKQKPTRHPVWLELVFWKDKIGGKHDCLSCIPASTVAGPGTYTCSASPSKPAGWGVGCTYPQDFTSPFAAIQHSAKLADGDRRVRDELDGPDGPMVVHYTAVLVPAGRTFSGWQHYPVR
jgi:hypothetical protein